MRERTDSITARGLAEAVARHPYRIHARPKFDFAEDETQPGPRFEPSPRFPIAEAPVPGPLIATNGQTLDVNFTGATLADTHAYPPDSMGAAGPSQFIVAVNGRVRSFSKTTGLADGVLNADTDVFFNSVMAPPASNNFTSDPRIRYDRLSRRWFIIMIDVPGQAGALPNRVMIAVSDSAIITGSSIWTFFYFQHDLVGATPNNDTDKFADYPTLGIDANALYIGVNVFGSRGLRSSFSNTTGFVIRKSSILGPGPIVVTAFRELIPNGNSGGPFTPHGVDNYDPAATEGYFIGVNSRFYGKLTLVRVSKPAGTPSIAANVNIDLPSINGPTIDVPHLGNTGGAAGELDGLDYRLLAAHLRNGQLWTTENMAVTSNGTRNDSATDRRDAVRWYVLTGIPTGQTPAFSQWGTVYDSTAVRRSYWMGSVMVSGQGHAAMGFSVAGPSDYANAGTVGRLANDPAGQMRTPVLYTASSTAYNPRDSGGSPINRWGDYSYTCLDPSDDMTMWTIQEFCNATNSYGVQVVRLLAPAPATPTNCSPSSVAAGAANVNVVVTGMSDGATGFFDPGAGFSNRISAVISGAGITLNSVTYSNPTHVTLNLSVSGGTAPGGRTVTIVNPDGQSAASPAALLTITSGAINSPPVLTAIPDKTINELSVLAVTNSATDPNGDTLTYSLDPGGPAGASINATTGIFTWIPNETQGPGIYTNTVRVTDNGSPPLSDTKSFRVTVNEVNSPPTLNPVANRTIHQGATLAITNTATDADIPTNILTFSFAASAPPGATIGPASGVFNWTPSAAFINTTNPITLKVADNGIPVLAGTNSFTVTVVGPPQIQSIVLTNNSATITWSAISGQTYRLQFRDNFNLPGWSNLVPDVFASGPAAARTDPAAPAAARYYRVMWVP